MKHLTPEDKLRIAVAVLIHGVDQHHVAALFDINQGRVSEITSEVRKVLWK